MNTTFIFTYLHCFSQQIIIFQFSFQPSEQNIQVDWSLKIRAVEHHWNQTSSLKLFYRSGNVFHIEFLIVRSRAAFWGSHWTDVTLECLVGSCDSFLHAPLSGMWRQRGDTIFIFRAKKISDQSSVYLSSKLCISVVSFISFIFVPCLPSTLERESRCDKACMIRSTRQQNGDVGRLEILQLSDLEIFPQAQDSF